MSDTLKAMAQAMDAKPNTVRRLILAGFLDPGETGLVAGRTRRWQVCKEHSLHDEMDRANEHFPVLDTIELASEFGDLRRLLSNFESKPPPLRLMQVTQTILNIRNGGTHRIHARVAEIVGGKVVGNLKYVNETCDSNRIKIRLAPQTAKAMTELGVSVRFMAAFARLGLLSQDGKASRNASGPCDLQAGAVAATLMKRLTDLPNAPFALQRVVDVNLAKEALGIPPDEWVPSSIVRDCIDWHEELGSRFSIKDLQLMVGGDRAHILSVIQEARTNGNMIRYGTSRAPKVEWTVQTLRQSVDPHLAQCGATVLDKSQYDPAMMPDDNVLSTIMQITHPELRIVAQVVVLHAFAEPVYRNLAVRLHKPMIRLEPMFIGLNPVNAGDIKRILDAYYLETLADDSRGVMRTEDILKWGKIVEIYASYEQTPFLPNALRTFLAAHRPKMPVASHKVFQRAHEHRQKLLVKNRQDRFDSLEPLLENVPAYLEDMDARRKETQLFRAEVHKTQKEALPWPTKTNEGADLEPAVGRHETIFPDGPLGRSVRTITFKVYIWEMLLEKLGQETNRCLKKIKKTPAKMREGFKGELFENRFAVELVSCAYEDGSEAPEPYWFSFHRDQIFNRSRNLTARDTRNRKQTMEASGLSEGQMGQRLPGCGNFVINWSTIARYVRQDFGMVLLPIEEHDHFEAIGIYAIAGRTSMPIRTGEYAAIDIGENLRFIGDDGKGSSVASLPRKMKPGNHDFVLPERMETRAVELLNITRRRIYGGGPIPETTRPRGVNDRAPEKARFILAFGERSVGTQEVDVASACLSVGHPRFQGKDTKLLWNMLEKDAGRKLEQRAADQGHSSTVVTSKHYDPYRSKDRDADHDVQTDWHADRRRRSEANEKPTQADIARRLEALNLARDAINERLSASSGNRDDLFAELAEVMLEISRIS